MARKSPWQQFSDNFSSVYGTFQELGRGLETGRIMREKPVEEMVQEGPRNSYERATGKWTYGGQTYDKEITPDMLRGLQYNRLGDVMAKYGDPTGAMAMRTSAAAIETSRAQLEATNLGNELSRQKMDLILEQLVLQNENLDMDVKTKEENLKQMVEGWPLDQANKALIGFGYKIDNDRNMIKLEVEEATKDLTIELAGITVEKAKVDLANERLKGEGYRIDNDGNLIKLGIDRATQKDEIALKGLEVEAKKQANINSALYGTGLVLDNRGKLVAAETAEDTQVTTTARITAEDESAMAAAKAKESAARLENNANVNLLKYSEKLKAGDFKEPGAGKKWLEDRWSGDPETLAMIESLGEKEINDILRESAVFMAKVDAASIGGRSKAEPALMALVDAQDGIEGNLQILDSEDGLFIEMVETDADGKNPKVIARGEDWDLFVEDLTGNLSPARAVQLETNRLQVDKLKAQIAELTKVGLTEADVEKEWLKHFSGVEEALATYHGETLSSAEIAEMKYNYYNNVIARVKANSSGLSDNDGAYEIEVLNP